ncbi:MAG: hypothetical protein F4139_04125 [Gemmatimonadetes bacterium]|nr:hypothetical protein [Gemmatimonadota bacterium]MYH52123.1 hypothetical protein [Gemmatimonadota bacterium]MYK67234.1 hypothetical protein [Gemmatimonadota bacterium]
MSGGESGPDRKTPDGGGRGSGSGAPAGLLAGLVIGVLALPGVGGRWYLHGDFNVIHALFTLFFSTNLLICYWEMCLYFRRDHIGTRAEHWRRRRRETGRIPAIEFLTSRMPLRRFLSPKVGGDVWSAYSTIDPSYSDRGSLAFNVDIGNGFVTPLPTLFLYAAYTLDFVPAVVAGIVGAMLFWQWAYVSSLYWVGFLVAGRQGQHHVSRGELVFFVGVLNAIWVLFGVFGMYVSIRLILEGGYGILGY